MEYDQTDITEVMGEASSPDDTLITLDSRGKKWETRKVRVMSYQHLYSKLLMRIR